MILVENLKKSFRDHVVLKDISFHVEQNEIFGIVGLSGAGKSTLFRCLSGLTKADSGKILVEGKPYNPNCQDLGIVFQHFNLLSSKTALENVMFPLELKGHKNPKDEALNALKVIGIDHLAHHYPAQLSGGQKQKVSVARAIALKPKILLLDEPTSALDPKSTKDLLDLLLRLNKEGQTMIIITHEMDLVKSICHKVAVLDEGRIIESGSVAQIFSHPKHTLTKTLIEESHHLLPDEFLTHHTDRELLRLYFRGGTAKDPIISTLIKEHQIDVNILRGAIDCIQNQVIGQLTIEIRGEMQQRRKAIEFLESRAVEVEKLS